MAYPKVINTPFPLKGDTFATKAEGASFFLLPKEGSIGEIEVVKGRSLCSLRSATAETLDNSKINLLTVSKMY